MGIRRNKDLKGSLRKKKGILNSIPFLSFPNGIYKVL